MAPPSRLPIRVAQLARRVRWIYVLETARWIYAHGRDGWERLSAQERRELGRLVRKTRGRPGSLTRSEREELRRIVVKAVGFGR